MAVLLAGCARSSLTLMPGEAGAKTGAVAVLDPVTGEDVAIVDRANSRTRVKGAKAHTHSFSRVSKRDAALLEGLPYPPSRFILYFREGTSDLLPSSQPIFEAIFTDVKARGDGVDVQIEGHTDTLGSDVDNDALSVRRAQEVLELLAARGIDPSVARAVGRGERDLREPTEDGVRSLANRRVEVVVR